MENTGEMRILIVEDKKDTASVVQILLKTKLQASSDIAPDCSSARKSLASNSYDLITMDYQLPDGDGLSLMEEIVGRKNAPPVVMVTGHGDEQTAVSAFKLGASGYVVKDARMSTMLVEEARSALARAGQAEAEEELRESEEMYRTLVEASPDAVIIADIDARVMHVSATAVEMFGYQEADELIGRSAYEFFTPKDRERARENFRKRFEDSSLGYIEYKTIKKDGSSFDIELSVSVFHDASGNPRGIMGIARDITERKHIEESLRERETHLRALTQGAMDAIILIDNKTNICHWNPAAENLYGFTAEEAIGQSVAIIYPEPRRQAYMSALERFNISGDRTFTREEPSEMSFIGKHRAEFPVEVSISRLRINDEWYEEVIARDITGRKGAEDRLKEHERELSRTRALLEETGRMARVGGWEFDVDTGKQVWTLEMYLIHEVDPDFEPTIEKGISFYAPEAVPSISEAVRRAIEEGEPFDVELRFITAKGNERWVRAIGEAERIGGQTVKVRGTFQDVTDRKQAEEALQKKEHQLSLMFDNVAEVLFYLSVEPDGRYRFLTVNDAFLNATGLLENQVVGKYVHEVIPEPSLTLVLAKYKQAIQDNATVRWEEVTDYPAGRKHGDVAVTPIFDSSGCCTNLLGSVHDVTERKAAEEALQLANIELEGYAHTVSHDLKGPLSSIAAAADLLSSMLEGIGDDEGEALGIIRNSVKHALNLTENLLGLAEVEQAPATAEPVDILGVVRSILEEKEAQLEERGIRVSLEGDLGVAAIDPTHAYQVFSNLISNAIKYNDSENPEIHISRLGEAEPGAARYLVRDNGPGIPEGAEEDIFLPFHKGENSTDTGIGLSIVDKVVRLYGGTIRAYNGGGACFEFTLPHTPETGEERLSQD